MERLSARLGRLVRLADVPDSEWDTLARLGFDIVWLMGVWRRSPESRRIALANPGNVAQYDRALPGWKPDDVLRARPMPSRNTTLIRASGLGTRSTKFA